MAGNDNTAIPGPSPAGSKAWVSDDDWFSMLTMCARSALGRTALAEAAVAYGYMANDEFLEVLDSEMTLPERWRLLHKTLASIPSPVVAEFLQLNQKRWQRSQPPRVPLPTSVDEATTSAPPPSRVSLLMFVGGVAPPAPPPPKKRRKPRLRAVAKSTLTVEFRGWVTDKKLPSAEMVKLGGPGLVRRWMGEKRRADPGEHRHLYPVARALIVTARRKELQRRRSRRPRRRD
jgi:hypothetical protein